MDTVSKEVRSRNMSAIRSTNTKPELFLRKLLFSQGYRYRLYSKKLPGKPDLWLRKYNTAIFVHGCYWHRHQGCRLATTPSSNTEFWNTKFEKNTARDEKVYQLLKDNGIRVLIVWECTLKRMKSDKEYCQSVLKQIKDFLHSDKEKEEI